MKKLNFYLYLGLVVFVLFNSCTLPESSKEAMTWPQFRGTNSLGIAPESATPPIELNPDKNLAWKTNLASGVSSPCVYKNMIFVTGFDNDKKSLLTYCIDFKKGSIIWQNLVTPDSLEQSHPLSSPAATTPVTDGKAVYVYFGSYGVICYDLSGNLRWKNKLPVLKAMYGICGSPVIFDSLLLINRVGLVNPSILAINKNDGNIVWQHYLSFLNDMQKAYSVSHASPVIWRDQVILHRCLGLTSLFLKDGTEAWSLGVVSSGVGTPIVINDTLYVNGFLNLGETRLYDDLPDFNSMLLKYDSNHDKLVNISEIPSEWAFYRRPELDLPLGHDAFYPMKDFAPSFDKSGDKALSREEWEKLKELQASFKLEHGTVAVSLLDSSGNNKPSVIWKQKEYVSEVTSLLINDYRVYMIMDGGIFSSFKTAKGDLIFRERIKSPGPYMASPLYANGYIYLIAYNGKVTVIKPADKLDIISRSDLKEKVTASPVALSNTFLVRTESALYAFRE
jgi:outer membrane protein assembly factor BamB